jgi:hypothetical protein
MNPSVSRGLLRLRAKRSRFAALSDDLREMLGQIESGELAGSAALRHRIEGALTVLDVALGKSPRAALGLAEPPSVRARS